MTEIGTLLQTVDDGVKVTTKGKAKIPIKYIQFSSDKTFPYKGKDLNMLNDGFKIVSKVLGSDSPSTLARKIVALCIEIDSAQHPQPKPKAQ
jgi:hypothetical protein